MNMRIPCRSTMKWHLLGVCKHFRGRTFWKGKGKGRGKGKKGYKSFKPYRKGGKGKGRSHETDTTTDTATSFKGKGKTKSKSGHGKRKGKGKSKAAGEPDTANIGGKGPGPKGYRPETTSAESAGQSESQWAPSQKWWGMVGH